MKYNLGVLRSSQPRFFYLLSVVVSSKEKTKTKTTTKITAIPNCSLYDPASVQGSADRLLSSSSASHDNDSVSPFTTLPDGCNLKEFLS